MRYETEKEASRLRPMDSFDKVNDEQLQSSGSIHCTSAARDPKEDHLHNKSYLMSFIHPSCPIRCIQSVANN